MASSLAKSLLQAIETMYLLRCELETVEGELKVMRSALVAAQRKTHKLQKQMKDISQNVLELQRSTRSAKMELPVSDTLPPDETFFSS